MNTTAMNNFNRAISEEGYKEEGFDGIVKNLLKHDILQKLMDNVKEEVLYKLNEQRIMINDRFKGLTNRLENIEFSMVSKEKILCSIKERCDRMEKRLFNDVFNDVSSKDEIPKVVETDYEVIPDMDDSSVYEDNTITTKRKQSYRNAEKIIKTIALRPVKPVKQKSPIAKVKGIKNKQKKSKIAVLDTGKYDGHDKSIALKKVARTPSISSKKDSQRKIKLAQGNDHIKQNVAVETDEKNFSLKTKSKIGNLYIRSKSRKSGSYVVNTPLPKRKTITAHTEESSNTSKSGSIEESDESSVSGESGSKIDTGSSRVDIPNDVEDYKVQCLDVLYPLRQKIPCGDKTNIGKIITEPAYENIVSCNIDIQNNVICSDLKDDCSDLSKNTDQEEADKEEDEDISITDAESLMRHLKSLSYRDDETTTDSGCPDDEARNEFDYQEMRRKLEERMIRVQDLRFGRKKHNSLSEQSSTTNTYENIITGRLNLSTHSVNSTGSNTSHKLHMNVNYRNPIKNALRDFAFRGIQKKRKQEANRHMDEMDESFEILGNLDTSKSYEGDVYGFQTNDNVLSSLCKKRPKKPGASRPPSRHFVRRLGSSSNDEEVTFFIDTSNTTPTINVERESIGRDHHKPSLSLNVPSIEYNSVGASSDVAASQVTTYHEGQMSTTFISSHKVVINEEENEEKQMNVSLITKALNERNLVKQREDVPGTFPGRPLEVQQSNIITRVNSTSVLREEPGLISRTEDTDLTSHKENVKREAPALKSKPMGLFIPPGITKPSEISKRFGVSKPFGISKPNEIPVSRPNEISKPIGVCKPSDFNRFKTSDETKNLTSELDDAIAQLNSICSDTNEDEDESTTSQISEDISTHQTRETNNNRKQTDNTTDDDDDVEALYAEIKNNTAAGDDSATEDHYSTPCDEPITSNRYSPIIPNDKSLLTRSHSESPKISDSPKNFRSIPRFDRTQSDGANLRKENNDLTNKTYLELETLKNINQKSNEKSILSQRLSDSKQLSRSFGSIENVAVKRYQRIETSDFFNYKKSTDDVRSKDSPKQSSVENLTNILKSKPDVFKDARSIRDRDRGRTSKTTEGKSNINGRTTDVKSNVTYIPYNRSTSYTNASSSGSLRPRTRTTDSSMLPRLRGSSASGLCAASYNIKPSPFSSRYVSKNKSVIETKAGNMYT